MEEDRPDHPGVGEPEDVARAHVHQSRDAVLETRRKLAAKGLGLHCDLQNEHAIVGNNVGLLLMINYGTEKQKAEWIDDLAEGGFQPVIPESDNIDPDQVKRVVFCSGKVYYDLAKKREEKGADDTAILRVDCG